MSPAVFKVYFKYSPTKLNFYVDTERLKIHISMSNYIFRRPLSEHDIHLFHVSSSVLEAEKEKLIDNKNLLRFFGPI